MDTALLIANPAASQFTGGLHRSAVRALRKRHDLSVAWPHSAAHARQLAAEAAADGVALVIAMGGDGIVHHVGQSLVGTESVLGIIPAGTTNVLGRMLGTPKRPSTSVKMLASPSRVHSHSVLEVDTEGPDGSDHTAALFSFGIGVDAAIVQRAESEPYRKYRFGSLHYARTAVSTVRSDLSRRKPDVWVEVGGRRLPAVGLLAQFQEVFTYFGRMPLNLGPAPPDPLTVLVVKSIRARRAGSILRGALGREGLGQVRGLQVVERVDSFTAVCEHPVEIQADGEYLGQVTRVEARFSPLALRVAVPQVPLR